MLKKDKNEPIEEYIKRLEEKEEKRRKVYNKVYSWAWAELMMGILLVLLSIYGNLDFELFLLYIVLIYLINYCIFRKYDPLFQ